MRHRTSAAALAGALFFTSAVFGAPGIVVGDGTVGKNLQSFSYVRLTEPAPEGGLVLTLTSDDPALLLLSKSDSVAGSPSIQLELRAGWVRSLNFLLQARGDKGTVTYTASAPGFGSSKGTITLAPSGILVSGPFRVPAFPTTSGAGSSTIVVYSAQLDAGGRFVEKQPVAGGSPVTVELTVSDPLVGTILDSPLQIAGGEAEGATKFTPARAGETTIAVSVPPGFTAPAEMASVKAIVSTPGLVIANDIVIGKNLQRDGMLGLGQAAPEGGVDVTITSGDPSKLVVSRTALEEGSKSITVRIPAGQVKSTYVLQALGDSGPVEYTATAPGYRTRVATVILTPSGVVMTYMPLGPPDRAEVHRPHEVHPPQGFSTTRDAGRDVTNVAIWLVQLDPVTRRGADITVQELRAGITAKVRLQNSDPTVGSLAPEVMIEGGRNSTHTEFKPLRPGKTTITVLSPQGFAEASNSTTLPVTVKE